MECSKENVCGGPGCGKCGEYNRTTDFHLNPGKKPKNFNQKCPNGLVSTFHRWIGLRNWLTLYLSKNEENFKIFSGNVNFNIFFRFINLLKNFANNFEFIL